MKLTEQINADFMTAYKEGNTEKKTFLGLLKSEVKSDEGRGIEATDENVTKVIVKMNKSLKESRDAGDVNASTEMEWLNPYLPQLMSYDDILNEVKTIVNDGADNLGMVMKEFNIKFKGKADNNEVRQAAMQILM